MTTAGRRRAYRSPRREQQAAETRSAVIDAAVQLFGERGWAGTGMREVASAAGVSVETVYANFKTKTDLLMAAFEISVVGDVEPVPLDARPEFAALGSGPREQRVRAAARLVTGVQQRTAGVHLALREGAASDPALAERRGVAELSRRADIEHGMALIVGHPVGSEAIDGLWAVLTLEVYELLTGLRGWSSGQYEEWIAGVIGKLLPDGEGS